MKKLISMLLAAGLLLIGCVALAEDADLAEAVITETVTEAAEAEGFQPGPGMMMVHTGNNGRLNLRQGPDTGTRRVAQYANGTQVEVLAVNGEWGHVRVDGRQGYMMMKFLAPMQGEQPQDTGDDTAQELPELPENAQVPPVMGQQRQQSQAADGNNAQELPELPENAQMPPMMGQQAQNGNGMMMPGNGQQMPGMGFLRAGGQMQFGRGKGPQQQQDQLPPDAVSSATEHAQESTDSD